MNHTLLNTIRVAAAVLDAATEKESRTARREPIRNRGSRTYREERPVAEPTVERWSIKIGNDKTIVTVLKGDVLDINTDRSFFARSKKENFIKEYMTNYSRFNNTEAAIMKSASALRTFRFDEITYTKL